MIYTLCVIGALALATGSLRIPVAIRFLSEVSLVLYRHVIEWRRLLGRRARSLLGT